MKKLKWFGLGLLALILLMTALNWTTIKRLQTVNTVFDADKIVRNFSNMDGAFLHHDLTLGKAKPWPEDIQPLPETVTLAGVETKLSDALEELDTTALVIIHDGTLIHESYYKETGRDDLRISWSVAKSFMSGLYGQAIEEGLMDISNPIEFYLPELKGTAYEGASVANILNMASGVRYNEDYMDPKSDINDMGRVLGLGGSMDEYTQTLVDRQYEPGTVWQYVSIDTHVAAMALRKVTGKSLHQLWEETYGAHLGMGKSPFYLTDGEDVAFALGGLNLRTRDYAKFGQLFLQGGEWEGEQIVPAAWVKDSTINHAPNVHPVRGSGYGYQWWVPMPQEGPSKGDFFAVGIYGQYIYVNPARNIVIAKNAGDLEFTFEQSNGQHSMNMNIDIFRSLAEQLAIRQKSDLDAKALRQGVKVWFKNSQLAPFLIHATTDDIENDQNFAEVFGIAGSKDGAFDELLEAGWLETDSALPNADELEIIWKTMLEEIKAQHSVSNKHADEISWQFSGAECVERAYWVCEATFNHLGKKVVSDFSHLMLMNIPSYELPAEKREFIFKTLESWDGKTPTHKFIQKIGFENQNHEVVSVTMGDYGDPYISIQSDYWIDGSQYSSERQVAFLDGKAQYQ